MARVLLVQSPGPVRRTLSELLVIMGHQVEEADGEERALACFVECPPDLVVTELAPWPSPGRSLIRRLRRAAHAAPVVGIRPRRADVGAVEGDEAHEALDDEGFCRELLERPIDARRLRDAIRSIVS